MNIQEARELKIPNTNTKLACEFFFHISFAPNPGIIREAHFEKVFFVTLEKERIYIQLADFYRVPFNRLSSMDTLIAEGCDANEFRKDLERETSQHDRRNSYGRLLLP